MTPFSFLGRPRHAATLKGVGLSLFLARQTSAVLPSSAVSLTASAGQDADGRRACCSLHNIHQRTGTLMVPFACSNQITRSQSHLMGISSAVAVSSCRDTSRSSSSATSHLVLHHQDEEDHQQVSSSASQNSRQLAARPGRKHLSSSRTNELEEYQTIALVRDCAASSPVPAHGVVDHGVGECPHVWQRYSSMRRDGGA